MPYLLAIDQGTTGSTALVLDEHLATRGRADCDFPQHFPAPGWVEHDPAAIWASVLQTIPHALAQAGIEARQLAAIGLTNQRETTVLWDRASGEPVHRAIVWQDRRTAAACAALQVAGHGPRVRELTGLPIDPYFCATKLRWLLDQPGLQARAERGSLQFGTIDTFLLHRLTGGKAHATEPGNASRTLLFDLHRLEWSDELCRLFRIPRSLLPEVRPSAGLFGHTRGVPGLPDGIPITGIAGDQQAALFGQACHQPGMAKCTYGTGCFLLRHTGATPVASAHGLVTTVAWQLGGEVAYALEGSAFIAGAAIQWLCDGLGLFANPTELEQQAASVASSDGIVFVPALTGLGAPHWRPEARGMLHGLTRGTTRAHLARAALEGIALQNLDLLLAMDQDAGSPLRELRVDGGAAANDLLLQFQADLLGLTIQRPQQLEATAFGAACLAGLGVGLLADASSVATAWQPERRFEPRMATADVQQHRSRWANAVGKA